MEFIVTAWVHRCSVVPSRGALLPNNDSDRSPTEAYSTREVSHWRVIARWLVVAVPFGGWRQVW